jgi:hypothetical protein
MRRMVLLGGLILVLLLALACAGPAKVALTVAPTAAPPTDTPAPTAALPPMDTPVPSPQIEDLVGWWNLNGTQFFIRFDPGGRMAAVMSSADYRLSGIGSWDGPLSLEDGVVELETSKYPDPGSGQKECTPDLIERYRVQVASPDRLEWSLIEDPCVQRLAYFDGVVYTRARPLEMLTGVWKAGSQDGAILTLRDNLLYQVTQGASGKVTPVVWGAYNWDAQLDQLVFFDEALKPCGVTFSGAYRIAIDAEGRLTLTCVLDTCEERRRALSEWGPYTRIEAPAWAGRYVAQGAEHLVLDLSTSGVYVLRDRDAATAVPLREGILDAEGQRMRLQELMGEVHCPRTPGEYEFRIAGDTLTLAATNDPCGERKSFFASRPTWVRVIE